MSRMLAAKADMHVVIVGGNHDGLLCSDDRCVACTFRPSASSASSSRSVAPRRPSETSRANVAAMLDGVPGARRVHVLDSESVDVRIASGELVRVVGSPWTSYDTDGKEHRSLCHAWRPKSGNTFGP